MIQWFKRIFGIAQLEDKINKLESRLSTTNTVARSSSVSNADKFDKLERQLKDESAELLNKVGWRKITKKLDDWKSEHEFVELYAHVYILDDGYRKELAPFLAADGNGKREVSKDNFKSEGTVLRCYMVTRLVLPGYFKLEDFLTNDSENFTFEKLFGRSYQSLVKYMAEFNYERTGDNFYTLNFKEI